MQRSSLFKKSLLVIGLLSSTSSFAMRGYTFLKLNEPKPYDLIVKAYGGHGSNEIFSAKIRKHKKTIQIFSNCKKEKELDLTNGDYRIYCHSPKYTLSISGNENSKNALGILEKSDGSFLQLFNKKPD